MSLENAKNHLTPGPGEYEAFVSAAEIRDSYDDLASAWTTPPEGQVLTSTGMSGSEFRDPPVTAAQLAALEARITALETP